MGITSKWLHQMILPLPEKERAFTGFGFAAVDKVTYMPGISVASYKNAMPALFP